MKKIIKILIPLCSLIILFTCFMGITAEAKEEVYVDVTAKVPNQVITIGSTTKIHVSAKANKKKLTDFVYSCDNKKVATVNAQGKIKAISSGECIITVYPKGYKDYCGYIGIKVVRRIIKISGPNKYEAGKTYQLKASEKNVIWDLHNVEYNAKASIDPKSGKIKIRRAGEIYISCISKDGKDFGAVYIKAKGPVIVKKDYKLNPINITTDEQIVSFTELEASGKLPKEITVPYTNGKKKGKIKAVINWDFYSEEKYDIGTYTIEGSLIVPDGYLADYVDYVQIDVNIKVAQTDTRKKVVSVEPLKTLVISKDEHIIEFLDIFDKYFSNTKVKCKLEDGSVVELPVEGIGYSKYLRGPGTYKCELTLKNTLGYDTGGYDGPCAKLTVKITKEQTWKGPVDSLDTIGENVIICEIFSQEPLSK